MFFTIFEDEDPVLNRKLANKYLLVIKKSRNERKKEVAYVKLFKMMKKVVVKNVKNYVKLARNSSVTEACHDEEEMYAEAYIVFVKCVEKFNVNSSCFYFYFNKSLSRTFYRMFMKEVNRHDRQFDYKSTIKNVGQFLDVYKHDIYSVELIIDSLDLDDFDRLVLKSKLDYQKKDIFIEEYNKVNDINCPVSRYYASLRKIKEQLTKLLEDGDI